MINSNQWHNSWYGSQPKRLLYGCDNKNTVINGLIFELRIRLGNIELFVFCDKRDFYGIQTIINYKAIMNDLF